MSENASLHDPEFIPISRSYQSCDRLIDSPSESISEKPAHHRSWRCRRRSAQQTCKFQRRGLFEGWKFTAFLAFLSSVVVLGFNLGFLVYSTGDCARMHRLNTVLHWAINSGTILLSASNFGMQCLIAPTRKDVDRAHRKGKWLDIGVPSAQNLCAVPWKRSFLWLCLCLSSLPFHMFYNSTIFYKTAVPAYDIFAGPGSLHEMTWSDVHLMNQNKTSEKGESLKGLLHAAKNTRLHHMDSARCVTTFAQTYQTSYRKLLLVPEDTTNNSYALVSTNPVYNPHFNQDPYQWICPLDGGTRDHCDTFGYQVVQKWAEKKNWTVNVEKEFQVPHVTPPEYRIQYCLAEPVPQYCSLQHSLPSTVAVIVSNVVKTVILLYIWLSTARAPLLTIGDGIASFLRRNDPYSEGMCIPSDGSTIYIHPVYETLPSLRDKELRRPAEWKDIKRRWGSVVSFRWAFLIFFWNLFLLIGTLLLCMALFADDARRTGLWKIKLGAITSQTIVSTDSSGQNFVANAITANLPQVVFSLLYFAFNNILTSMCVSAEWSRFGHTRKSVRVSHSPRLSQRSNYFLSIPYRYALPLIAISSILHWLVSESLFKISIEAYDSTMAPDPSRDLYACGYSAVAMTSALSIGAFMLFCLIGLSCRRFESAMPVAGSCSLAIAAACHPRLDPNTDKIGGASTEDVESEDDGEIMALLPVKWGSIPVDGPIGHCAFTSGDVNPPEKGRKYQ
ncbi:hypothetical protein N7512_006215 [Penicillium capsulatum]|nr:hypothetical protein N7512_006215 [Penicillium capsulatum]